MSMNEIGTGVIYHTCNDAIMSYHIQSSQYQADKVIKFCHGFNHMVLLKENGFIQPISNNSKIFDASFQYLQQLSIPIIDIAFGKNHAIALTDDYKVLSFGDNMYGQLGIGFIGNNNNNNNENNIIKHPQFIHYFVNVNQKIVQIKCGSYHSAALSQTGDIYTWGQGKYGQLGTKVISIQILPRYVAYIPNKKDFIQQIQCGPEGTAAISKNGNLYQWGYGQSTPVHIVVGDKNIKIGKISIGLTHSLCLTTCGKLYGWGLCQYGQLGMDANNIKKVTSPLLLKQFENDIIYDIECCGLYTVICTENNGIYTLGFNDSLFNKKQNINPYKINLTDQKIQFIGCSRYDFAVITATNISNITPSICCSNGTYIDIIGHGFYSTSFAPTVKFILKDDISIIKEGIFVQMEHEEGIKLAVTTPDLQQIEQQYNITYPYKMFCCVSMDGEFYSDPYQLYVIEDPHANDAIFNITPNCGDIYGDIKCIITDSTNYISTLTNIDDLKLNDIKIKLVNDTETHILDGFVNEINEIQFVTPSMNKGQYKVLMAMDGQQFIDTNTIFIGYNVECIKCSSDNIILSQYEQENIQSLKLEIEVNGFVYTNSDNIKLKFVGDTVPIKQNVDNDDIKMWFIADCIYESQSARDIADNQLKTKEIYKEKRAEIENNKEKELTELKESRKQKDEEREKWLVQTEKDRKKKKKPADLEAFEQQIKKVNDEWEEILKRRDSERREIDRKFKKQIIIINKEESRIPQQNEDDDGHGYIKCNVDILKLKQWIQPNNIQIKITSNGVLYSDLYSIQCINPKIKQLSPKIGLFSDSTKIKMFINGFDLKNIDKTDLKISIQDTEDKMIEIEEFEIDTDSNNNNFISMKVEGLTGFGNKQIIIKYKQLFDIKCIFLAHDIIKVSNITPNTFTINDETEKKMKVQIANDIDTTFVDECYIKINGNDKSMVLKGILSDDGKEIEIEFDTEKTNLLENIGAAKKAQIQISFNNQQWITAKQTISIK